MTIPSWAMQAEAANRRGRVPSHHGLVDGLGGRRESRRAERRAARRAAATSC
jgi:hypothetical protein